MCAVMRGLTVIEHTSCMYVWHTVCFKSVTDDFFFRTVRDPDKRGPDVDKRGRSDCSKINYDLLSLCFL